MAVTLAETPDTIIIRWTEFDVFNEKTVKTIRVGGDATDAEVEQFIGDYNAGSNAGMRNVSVSSARGVALTDPDLPAAARAESPFLSSWLGLFFEAPNPVNPSSPSERQLKIRAPLGALYGLDGNAIPFTPNLTAVGTTPAARLARLAGFIETYGVFAPSETDPLEVGTYVFTGSQLVTDGRVVDGDSLT